MMDSYSSTLNPDAAEFKPSGISEKVQSMDLVRCFVRKSIEGLDDEVEKNFTKIAASIGSQQFPGLPAFIGQCIVQYSVCKSGNAALGFRVIKRLQNGMNADTNTLLQNGIFNAIHAHSMSRVSEGHLKNMAEAKSLNGIESGDSGPNDEHPILLVELLHLIMMCITDLNKTPDGQVDIPPCQPCMDLCVLTDAAFKIQCDVVMDDKNNAATNKIETPSNPPKKVPLINGWHCLLDVFLTKMAQSIPYFNMLLQVSNEIYPPSTWNLTPATSDQPLQTDICVGNLECIYSASLLSNYIDRILFRVKRMIVNDVFTSTWLRSTALDLLLSAVPPNTMMSCGQGNDNDWAESPSLSGDDISIDGLTSTDDPDVLNAFRSFLESSGQVEHPNS